MTDSDATQGDNMSPAQFAKLMGAYPQPAENPLPTYGGFMDNSAANFSWVQNNDYFGAESNGNWVMCDFCSEPKPLGQMKRMPYDPEQNKRVRYSGYHSTYAICNGCYRDRMKGKPVGKSVLHAETFETDEWNGLSAEEYYAEMEELTDGAGSITPNENWKEIANGDYREWMDTVDGAYDETYFVDMKKMKIYLVKFFFDVKGSIEACNWAKENLGIVCDGMNNFSKTFNYDPVNPQGHVSWVGFEKVSASKQIMKEIPIYDAPYTHMEITESDKKFKMAEMEELTDGVASITNRFGDGVGIIQVDDEDLEDVSVEITDGDGDVVYEGILGDEDVPEMEEDDFYYSEDKKKSSILPMALGIAGAIFAYQPMMDFLARKTKKEEKMAETPELIENPNTGNLDPAQYEEMVVESTGYAVDVIPQGLDGSFMGSRFAALPTERYVEYNEPGIGAHTDIALDRNEMYLEPEMAMVQASESVKESQAPGQSPYNSVDGEENRDFDMRVLKETQVISLDPAVKPFIPQSMSGYTGNANTPPSVYDKMFNIGVLGQTPAFVPGSGDIGSSHTGSRSAIPNSLGIAGSVGGPLSDQVNANYTDGTTSMSLAQWAIENTVSQSSDTEAVVIDRSSGQMKRVRRV